MKKLLSMLLCAAMLLCWVATPAGAAAKETKKEDAIPYGLKYSVADEKVTILGYEGPKGAVRIPATIGGYPITRIERGAFNDNDSVTAIYLPASVEAVGKYAFLSCDNLTGIWVDEKNPYLSSDSYGVLFDKEKQYLQQAPGGLEGTYIMPDSVDTLGSDSFGDCEKLTCVVLSDRVTGIGKRVFVGCTALTQIVIPESLLTIAWMAFDMCSNLKTVYYSGTKAQWDAIEDYGGNDDLHNANIIFQAKQQVTGELNGDGTVDNRDVEYLLWHTLYPEEYPIFTNANFNRDGSIDNQDVEYLLWHTLFPEDYPI